MHPALGQRQNVAHVGLVLKEANAKCHRFDLLLLADDMEVPKNNRTIDEPIFFTVGGQKGFYELVVNKVEPKDISTPTYGAETASSQTLTR
jgi:hypothetical protein